MTEEENDQSRIEELPSVTHGDLPRPTTSPSEHTPGPWYVGAQNDMLYIIDKPPRPSNDYPRHDATVAAIAKIYHSGMWKCEEANARLIAAAPELLAALKEAERTLILEGYESYAVLVIVRAAIAKAEGR